MFDYKAKRWVQLRARVLRRDGFMCQLSKRYGKAVQADIVHHIYPVDEFPEFAWKSWNLISLSRAQHNALHDRTTNALTAEGIALMQRTRIPGNYQSAPPLCDPSDQKCPGGLCITLSHSDEI